MNAVRLHRALGIFVAFEEPSSQIIANSAGFDWGLENISAKQIYFMNARLSREVVKAGNFDLAGMLAMLAAKKQEIGAQWIVFDGIDVLLTQLQNPAAEVDEIYRIRDWLDDSGLTAIVTTKSEERLHEPVQYGFMQFMADCVVRLGRRQEDRVASQLVQMMKYRGSGFAAAEFPMTFGPSGIGVFVVDTSTVADRAPTERISLGFNDLDALLGGGVYRGSSTLISGLPGTAKTTLAGKFLETACARGERALYVSYDEGVAQIVRNLASVSIHLNTPLHGFHFEDQPSFPLPIWPTTVRFAIRRSCSYPQATCTGKRDSHEQVECFCFRRCRRHRRARRHAVARAPRQPRHLHGRSGDDGSLAHVLFIDDSRNHRRDDRGRRHLLHLFRELRLAV